jgi:hypothetical protein
MPKRGGASVICKSWLLVTDERFPNRRQWGRTRRDDRHHRARRLPIRGCLSMKLDFKEICARCGEEAWANATDGQRLFYVHLYPSDHAVTVPDQLMPGRRL